MSSFRCSYLAVMLLSLAGLGGCYERQPVEIKIRPITGPSSSIGAPAKARPVEKQAEEAEQKKSPDEPTPMNSETSAPPSDK